MPKISIAHRKKMINSFRLDVARHLAKVAGAQETITYGALSAVIGVPPRSWGDILGGIAIRCFDNGYPLLPVIVVNASSKMPSGDAVLYEDLGLTSQEEIAAEQAKCFDYDWLATPLTQ